MISINYLDKDINNPNGQIIANVYDEAEWIYDKEDFPFVFEVWNSNKLTWSCELYPDYFASWDCLDPHELEVFIKDAHGNIISNFKLDPWVNRNSTAQFFEKWSSKNPNANGIVIGTHDGTSGEWIQHVKNTKGKTVLVEGSSDTFKQLVNNYKSILSDISFRNEVITSDGRTVQFFEYGSGEANTVNPDHFNKHVKETDTASVISTKSVSINDLIIQEGLQENLDWIQLDTESIDDEIIMGLDFSKVNKPSLIVFETINFSHERTGSYDRIDKLFHWLKYNGYLVKYDYWNSFAYLPK